MKAKDFVSERGILSFDVNKQTINTDIENLYYDEKVLNRKLPRLHAAKVNQN